MSKLRDGVIKRGSTWAYVVRVPDPETGHSRPKLFPFFRLAAYTGARRGELLALRWDALDLDAAEVTLRGSTDVIDGERVNGRSSRTRSRCSWASSSATTTPPPSRVRA